MKCGRTLLLILAFLFSLSPVIAQKHYDNDSLTKVFTNKTLPDSSRLGAIYWLAWQTSFFDPDSALVLAGLELKLAQEKKSTRYEADAYNTMGVSCINKGDLKNALVYNLKALEIRKKGTDTKSLSASLNNIGIIYYQQGDYLRSLDYFQQSLKLKEKNGDMAGVAAAYSNIAKIYTKEGLDQKSLDYYLASLRIRDSLHDERGMENSYEGLASYYGNHNDNAKMKEYTMKAIFLDRKLNHKKSLANNLSNLGMTFERMNEPDSAQKYYYDALQLRLDINDSEGLGDSYNCIGDFLVSRKNYPEALRFCSKGLEIGNAIGFPEIQKDGCNCLTRAYDSIHDYKNALKYLRQSIIIEDSLGNLEKSKSISRKVFQYEYEKQKLADSLRVAKENEERDLENQHTVRQQKTYTIAGAVAFLLMVIIAIVLFRGYRQKQKNNEALEIKNKIITEQKQEVEMQKVIVDEKNKEVLDSITYAQRLQQAILPSEKTWHSYFPESFIFYRPKDIVAGDFYWVEKSGDRILFTAADCTGHGVPGALVSVVCSNALNRAVKEFGLTDPGKILDKVTQLVLETFEKSESEVSDGMDISLCCLDKKTNVLYWAGANNPLWVVSHKEGKENFIELKPDKQPIGQFDDRHPFNTQQVVLEKDSFICLFTDGFADQFGGPLGKKFKYKSLHELILRSSRLPSKEQLKLISKTFDDWKGELGQVDDVCVIGIKI